MKEQHKLVNHRGKILYIGTMHDCLSLLKVHSENFKEYTIENDTYTLFFAKSQGKLYITSSFTNEELDKY